MLPNANCFLKCFIILGRYKGQHTYSFPIFLFIFGILVMAAFLIYSLETVRKPLELAKMGKYDGYAESKKTIKEKVIFREVVMLPCQYCGSLMPQASIFCPHCGARRKN